MWPATSTLPPAITSDGGMFQGTAYSFTTNNNIQVWYKYGPGTSLPSSPLESPKNNFPGAATITLPSFTITAPCSTYTYQVSTEKKAPRVMPWFHFASRLINLRLHRLLIPTGMCSGQDRQWTNLLRPCPLRNQDFHHWRLVRKSMERRRHGYCRLFSFLKFNPILNIPLLLRWTALAPPR